MFAWSSDETERKRTIESEGLRLHTQVEVLQLDQRLVRGLDQTSTPHYGTTVDGGREASMHAHAHLVFGEDGVALLF